MKLVKNIGCGSTLYAEFKNGISYAFLHGVTLQQERLHDPTVYPLVAKLMARLHNIDIGSQAPSLWDRLGHFIDVSPDRFTDTAKQERFEKEYLTKPQLREEAAKLKALLPSCCSPVVFCHNDALLANIVLDGDKVSFIDLEYGAPSYAAY